MVAISLAIALAIALPLGAIAARKRSLGGPILAVLGTIYTIPSLALFALLIPLLGLGARTAIVALVLYAQMILVRNVVVGLRQVPPALVDAARGLGMTPFGILMRIELPQALPILIGGVRIATVSLIAIANLAAWINAGGLGVLLFDGLRTDDTQAILAGASASALFAIAADRALRSLEQTSQRRAAGLRI